MGVDFCVLLVFKVQQHLCVSMGKILILKFSFSLSASAGPAEPVGSVGS